MRENRIQKIKKLKNQGKTIVKFLLHCLLSSVKKLFETIMKRICHHYYITNMYYYIKYVTLYI